MTKVFHLKDLDCANCAAKMEHCLQKIDAINHVSVNFLTQKMMIDVVDDEFKNVMQQVVKICKKIEPDCKIVM
ncbi:MAG: cation transporter [Clostridia bacterium]|nr:cation transporter [Clostridia bacterium]